MDAACFLNPKGKQGTDHDFRGDRRLEMAIRTVGSIAYTALSISAIATVGHGCQARHEFEPDRRQCLAALA